MNFKLLLSIICLFSFFMSCSDSDENKSSEKELLNFNIENLQCVIQNEVIKIQIDSDMPTVYTPLIEVSPKASVSPKSGAEVDFSTPVTYTVTAEDGSFKAYTVQLIVNEKLSEEKDILKFTIDGYKTEIKDDKLYINAYSWQTDYGMPVLEVSEKAVVSPSFEEMTVLSWINKFTVTAEDGSTKVYPVVWAQEDGIKEIKVDFAINGQSRKRYIGVFDETSKTITIDYERTANNTSEGTLQITTRGEATTNPASGIALDLIPEKITVTTKDGAKDYTLRVRNTDNYINKVQLDVIEGIGRFAESVYTKYREGLEDYDICIFALENENIKNIVPSVFKYSDFATISPSATSAQDFSKDVQYTVTSQSGAIRNVKVRTIPRKIIVSNEHSTGYTIVNNSFFEYYHAIGQVSKVELINTKTKEIIPCTLAQQQAITTEKSYYYMTVHMSKTPAEGDVLYMRVTFPDGSVVDTDARYGFKK